MIGLVVASRASERRLDRYAKHLLQYAETYNSEISSTLDAVNASPFPFCSDDDISRLRNLVFHGHMVKEIGRVRGNELYCTSTNGRFDHPIPEGKPDIVTRTGRSVWLHAPLVTIPDMYGDITQSGEATFVAAQDAFGDLREAPMTYTTTLTNRGAGQVLRTAGEPLQLSNAEVLAERNVLRGSTFYVARCSTHFAPCMVVGITLRDAWYLNSAHIGGFMIIGSLAGVMLALTLILQPRKRNLATQLRRALRRNLLTVVYQPIVDVKTGKILGAEALARWTNEDGQYVRPDVFVAAAEELGFIGKLTRVVLRLIVAELGDFLRAHPEFHVNVNIAAADLADAQFLPMLEKLLRRHGVASESIGLELTERSTADHHLAISAIGKLRALGHEFYIDDFGTGYSSLNYLKRLPIDKLKIDRSFVGDITHDPDNAALCRSIVDIAHSLRLLAIAEGVETAAQAHFLSRHHCDQLQGFLFCKPLPAAEVESHLLESFALPTPEKLHFGTTSTVLIVDDDLESADALANAIASPHIKIKMARTAAEAFEALADEQMAIVMADYRMPDMNGVVLLERVKLLYPETIRMIVTAYPAYESAADAINLAGIFKFVAKPWDPVTLRSDIRSALELHVRLADDLRLRDTLDYSRGFIARRAAK
jgi:sensor c-di-GMP phosphodiesterase-like protein/ActR/RegA family two-component response regulator